MQEPITTSDRVFTELRQLIVTGEIKPGTRLVHRKLAKQFGTSNIPVLEALRRLERDGLVINYPNYGAHVKVWALEDIEEIYLWREALEGIACYLFAQRATSIERAMLRELDRQFDTYARNGDVQACDDADVALHLYIVQCAHAKNISQLADNARVISDTIKNNIWSPPGDALIYPQTVGVHDTLVTMLTEGTPDEAERAGREHVQSSRETIMAFLRSQHGLPDRTVSPVV